MDRVIKLVDEIRDAGLAVDVAEGATKLHVYSRDRVHRIADIKLKHIYKWKCVQLFDCFFYLEQEKRDALLKAADKYIKSYLEGWTYD